MNGPTTQTTPTNTQAAMADLLVASRALLEGLAADHPKGAELLKEFRDGPRTVRLMFDEHMRLLVVALVDSDGSRELVAALGANPHDASTFGRRLDDPMTDPAFWSGQCH